MTYEPRPTRRPLVVDGRTYPVERTGPDCLTAFDEVGRPVASARTRGGLVAVIRGDHG